MKIPASLLIAALPLLSQPQVLRGQQPGGRAFDVDIYGNLYVLQPASSTLRLFDRTGQLVRDVGGPGWQEGEFDRPAAVWARNGIDVYVADYGNHRIQRFDRSLNFVSTFSTRENDNPDLRFGYPTDVALSRLGELFICDTENTRIVKVDRFNVVERTFGGFAAGMGRLSKPTQLELGPKDAVYVLDEKRVAVFDAFGNYLRDLLPGLITHPGALYADPDVVIVLDSASVYFFNHEEKPDGVYPVTRIAPGVTEVANVALQGGTLRLLTPKGVIAAPDPRPKNPAGEP